MLSATQVHSETAWRKVMRRGMGEDRNNVISCKSERKRVSSSIAQGSSRRRRISGLILTLGLLKLEDILLFLYIL